MIEAIYTTVKATKKREACLIVSGITQTPNVLFPRAVLPFLFEADTVFGKATVKELKTYLKSVKPATAKGAAFLGTIQGTANGLRLSRSERKALFALLRQNEEETGLSSIELSALALAS